MILYKLTVTLKLTACLQLTFWIGPALPALYALVSHVFWTGLSLLHYSFLYITRVRRVFEVSSHFFSLSHDVHSSYPPGNTAPEQLLCSWYCFDKELQKLEFNPSIGCLSCSSIHCSPPQNTHCFSLVSTWLTSWKVKSRGWISWLEWHSRLV